LNKKNIISGKKNVGRPKKMLSIATKSNLYTTVVDLSTKETLSRVEAMIYLRCGKTWLNDQYNKEGGLFLNIHGCVKRKTKGSRVFFVRKLIDEAIKSLPDLVIG
jgi:hypothetical protein